MKPARITEGAVGEESEQESECTRTHVWSSCWSCR
jgi:hypothetical protein